MMLTAEDRWFGVVFPQAQTAEVENERLSECKNLEQSPGK